CRDRNRGRKRDFLQLSRRHDFLLEDRFMLRRSLDGAYPQRSPDPIPDCVITASPRSPYEAFNPFSPRRQPSGSAPVSLSVSRTIAVFTCCTDSCGSSTSL